MSRMARFLLALAAFGFLVAASAAAGGTGEPTKALKVGATLDEGYFTRNDPVANDILVKQVKAGILRKTGGVDVQVEWASLPPDTQRDRYLNKVISAGDYPEILALQVAGGDPTSMKIIQASGIAWPITEDMIRKNMHSYTARLQKYGLPLKAFLKASSAFTAGVNLYLPTTPYVPALSKAPSYGIHDFWVDPSYYALSFRDDILRKIYPNARTEQELKDLLLKKGSLTPEDIAGDIPIHTWMTCTPS